jgi:hypothetical protein
LFEEFARHAGLLGDVGDHHRLAPAMFGEHDKGMQGVSRLLRKHEGFS